VFRAIHSPRQLHEVLAQFFQNHFTTQYQKTEDYFLNNFSYSSYTNATYRDAIALELHWREHKKFRDALLNPDCTFFDLLKISIESPAMIIYLDTVLNSKAAPNQNYAREIMELHTMGADNGYIQQDIVDLSKVWTGWRVDKKDASVADNPFATPLSRSNITNFVDAAGVWVLHYNTNQHDTGTKRLFTNGPIAARFGAAFGGGQPYSIILTNTQAGGTNGFREGYTVISNLANLPYTMEYLSVKLCRLFVHENFSYGVYDYTAPNPSLEVQLVRDCMAAWNTAVNGRKGNIRSVLNVIFNSALFRGQGASHQKIKTPLEYAASAVRALRIANTDTNGWITSTCDSDGYGISGKNGNTPPMIRMGTMQLFNKAEPDGYSEFGRLWLNTANLNERMRFVQHLMMATSSTIKDDDYGSSGLANTSDPVALLKAKLPSTGQTNAATVVDFFLGLLYPGEGAGNMGRDRQAAIDHLNLTEAGTAGSAFNTLTGTAYDGRVRSMVGFLLSLPRFQEQ
jgi:large repetitive protein